MIFIKKLIIKELFGSKNITIDFIKDVQVLVGINGVGKTTILNIINDLLLNNKKSKYLKSCTFASIELEDERVISYENDIQDDFDLLLDNFLKNSEDDMLNNEFHETLMKNNSAIKKALREHSKNQKFSMVDHEIKVKTISTADLKLKSLLNLSIGDSDNMLDEEIERELSFMKGKSLTKRKDLSDSLCELFSESNKEVIIDDNGKMMVYSNQKGGVIFHEISELSSGERQVIYILMKIANIKHGEKSLILMDEPEISLHLSWQKKLIKIIKNINPNSQVIIVTHSPAIVMDGWRDSYIDISKLLND
ncbi:hypothetical protein C0W35_21900 [Photobacterium kishitanii]|uniref:AAA family ATPase n=1 Tax=Photobacterium kishitanii TaxID=318456 RepID=UPI000D170AB7|nr:AAA family ATPase [Photobacterium kishitanii]PSU86980.1 hypothetical protein C0W35_21900 [Photobacterium kishitanii]